MVVLTSSGSQKFLHGADVIAVFQQRRRKAITACVGAARKNPVLPAACIYLKNVKHYSRSARGSFQNSAIFYMMFVQSQYYNDEYRTVQQHEGSVCY
jgi:hypothetical protein